MQTMKKIESSITKKAEDIRTSINSTIQKKQDVQQKILQLKNEQIKIFQKIATIYLLESPNNTDFQIQAIIDQLQELLSNLNNKSHTLEQIIFEYQQKLTNILAKLDVLTTQKVLQLESDPDYVSLFNHFKIAEQNYEHEKKNFEASQEEFTKKLAQYSQNRYYTYLINRNFGEHNYKGFWIFANLDSWVARFINFSANYKNQKILESLLKESQIRFNTKQDLYQSALDEKARKEHEIETNLKIPPLKVELAQTEQDLANYKKQKQDTDITLNDIQSGQNIQFRKLSYQLANLLQQQPSNKLQNLTLQTETTEDDELLPQIQQLDNQIQQLETSLVSLQQTVEELEQTYNRFTNTLYIFKQNNIPSSFYEYDISLSNLEKLLNSLINKSIFPETIVQSLINCRVVVTNNILSNNRGWSITGARHSSLFTGSNSYSTHQSSRSSSSRSTSSNSSGGRRGFSTSSSTGGGGYHSSDSF